MRKTILMGLMATAAIAVLGTLPASAFPTSTFQNNSRLSTGKWVKIAVDHDGVYQLTAEQLAQMGFNDPSRVQIYGQGGHPISETMNMTSFVDDLKAVPTLLHEGKVIFYGQGSVGKELVTKSGVTYYQRSRNAYANYGYYFITEGDAANSVAQQVAVVTGTSPLTSSYNAFMHESELVSVGYTGKQLLGETIHPNSFALDYTLPLRCDSTISVAIGISANVADRYSYGLAHVVSGDSTIEVEFKSSQARISPVMSSDVQRFFDSCYPAGSVKLTDDTSEEGQLMVSINNLYEATVKMARLDYAIVTYKRQNTYEASASYFPMGFASITATDQVVMPGTDDHTLVWEVTDPQNIRQMNLTATDDGMAFTPGYKSKPTEFIAFRPDMELPTISSFSAVENQNLHALPTPDMLIVTNAYFMPEAQRLAQIHRDHDGMIVHVVDQELIFNEFSSGTPDAMGVRLFCKMFYDRDNAKFKNLLMFGPASYDYRGITTDKANRVITFETDESDTDAYSYASDDFFGMLDDGSGSSLITDMLRLGVGRLTPTDLDQARQNVDKIAHYILNPDYGPWRNHYMVWADSGDKDLHNLQAEGIADKIQQTLGIPMVCDKAYVDMFPLNGKLAVEAHNHVIEMLNAGQFYGTYVGHATPKTFTSHRMWTFVDVRNQNYDRQPILMTACCDVARFDSNSQGIAELMFHQPNGGAIALLASSREVEATQNDNLNQAFTQSMFNYRSTREMITLGEAYMKAKQSLRNSWSPNKMSYLLIGDPAIKVEYPRPLFNITSVNGVRPGNGNIYLSPLQTVTVEAQVVTDDGQLDSDFTGDATLSIYDQKQLLRYATYKSSLTNLASNLYYPRALLVEVSGRVENGHFTGTAVMPRYIKALPDEQLAIHVYAHKDNTSLMVNGMTEQVLAASYIEEMATADEEAPVIEAMFLNEEESFAQGVAVDANSMLHVVATDDVAFNNQSMGVGSSVKLTLDNGATVFTLAKTYVVLSDGGRKLTLDFPISGLTPGKHSLTFSAQDASGKIVERTISFMVGGTNQMTLATDDLVATQETVINLDETTLTTIPPVTLKVVDARGKLVWSQTTSSLPCSWDLTDTQGQRVAPGLYKMFGQYNDGVNFGGTNITPIIVMNPVNRAN